MPLDIRVGTFNVENLFSRPKLMNLMRHEVGDQHFRDLADLRSELRRTTYDEPEILRLWRALRNYITVVETRGKLFNRTKTQVRANGVNDWVGWIDFKREKFKDLDNNSAVSNTAKVIRWTNADIMCLCEVESLPVLRRFSSQKITGNKRYHYHRLIDSKDPRGIDVGLLSRHPVSGLWSHVNDIRGNRRIFSRDCLEVHLALPGNRDLWVLLNHFKSKGYGTTAENNTKRRRQAERVRQILQTEYDLTSDYVVVAGDLNDTPGSTPLRPLLSLADLHDVLATTFPNSADRWTYHYRNNEQIDYLLVSTPLHNKLRDAGIERRGIFDVATLSNCAIAQFSSIRTYRESASDHGAVWADFRLP
jgi:endonuclease/exonuclease/phosphatase family metal-dependent hydrolase